MATKIRLARHGKKGKPFYHIVTADSRAKRDGRYIERIGSYNPNTNPATIDIDFDRAMYWVGVGAQPTDTVRAMLSYKGVLYKNHLLNGVKKGALTNEQAEEKFAKWLSEKEAKIENKISSLAKEEDSAVKAKLASEKEKSEARAAALAEVAAEETAAEEAVAEATEEPVAEATEEQAAEEPAAEEPVAEATEEPATEEPATEEPATEEPAAEEAVEEATEEPAVEKPATEATEEPASEGSEETEK